jgi:hypothetical protein
MYAAKSAPSARDNPMSGILGWGSSKKRAILASQRRDVGRN